MFISRHVLLLLWCGPPGIIPIRRGRRARCQKSIYKLFVYKKPQCISLPVWAEYGLSMPFLAHLPGRPVRMTLYSLRRNVCFFDKLYVWHRINRISRKHNLFCRFAYAQSAYGSSARLSLRDTPLCLCSLASLNTPRRLSLVCRFHERL